MARNIRDTIQSLVNKTVNNGASPDEAKAAPKKARDLREMDDWHSSLLREIPC